MNKKGVLLLIVILLLIATFFYKELHPKIKINENKVGQISYFYEVADNKMGIFNMTDKLDKNDISQIVKSLNNGVLVPDEDTKGGFTLEHMELQVINDRFYNIYKQSDGKFIVMYSINPGSNDNRDDKCTTVESEVLQSYFNKFKDKAKSIKPEYTWDINKN